MKILFVGGTRFIGRAAALALRDTGHDVTVFHRGTHPAPDGVREILGDAAQLDDYRQQLRDAKPDVVVHMLLMEQGDSMKLLRVFKPVAKRAVVISSGDVYLAYGRLIGSEPGEPVPTPLSEDAPLREEYYPYRHILKARMNLPNAQDDWRYYYEKITVERVARSRPEFPATVLRLPMVYGPRDAQRRLVGYLKRMDDGREVILLDAQLAQWRTSRGFVENVGAAIARAATDERAAGRLYNLAEPDALSEAEWVRFIGAGAGWGGEVRVVPSLPKALTQPTNGQDLVLDSSRIRDELGYSEAVDRAEAVRRTIEWERANPPETPPALDYAAEDAIINGL